MKLILATESQPVALALQSVNGGTREAVDSICPKYSPRGTVMGFAETYVFSLENVPVCSLGRKRKGERRKAQAGGGCYVGGGAGREGGRATSAAVESKLTLHVASSYTHTGDLALL